MDVRRTLAVLLVGACVLASGAHAQGMRWLRGREGLGLTAADFEIQRATIRKTLDEEPDCRYGHSHTRGSVAACSF
jgi:hypothetical protein